MLVMQYKSGTGGPAPDPTFSNVVMLLDMDNNTTDLSSYSHAASGSGGDQWSTGTKKFGTHSADFDGSGDPYITASSAPPGIGGEHAYDFRTGDFTIEAWVNPRAAHPGARDVFYDMTIFGKLTSSPPLFFFLVSDTLAPAFWDGTTQHTSSVVVSPNEWTHVAASRSSGTLKLFVNGVQGYSATNTLDYDTIGACFIGGHGSITGRGFDGYIDELRVTHGEGIYTGTFAPPTTIFPRS